MYKILAKRKFMGLKTIKAPKITKKDCTKESPINTFEMIKTAIEMATVMP